jgi:hypothetical protein
MTAEFILDGSHLGGGNMVETGAAAPRWLLVAGLAAGALLAAAGLVAPGGELPDGAVARVNDRLIQRDDWLRAVAAVASERRTPLTAEDERHILDRLVDEELLVQHGRALGLVEHDGRLRDTLVSEVMLAATQRAGAGLDEAALRGFYAANLDFFAPAARLRVRAWRLEASGARAAFAPAVPDALLPPAKLVAYLGPTLVARATALRVDEISAPLPSGDARVELQLLEREASAAPPFEQVREQVRVEARRRADEAAVRALLADLRADGRVELRAGL